jgi:hypothetical protein
MKRAPSANRAPTRTRAAGKETNVGERPSPLRKPVSDSGLCRATTS